MLDLYFQQVVVGEEARALKAPQEPKGTTAKQEGMEDFLYI